VATVGGTGYVPLASGSVASALTVLVLWLVPASRVALLGVFGAVTLVGIWAAHRAERVLGAKDPHAIVIDEVAGMTLSVLAFPRTMPVLVVGFLLFRVFDVVKPFPARLGERLPGGVGVMADDLVAGLYAFVVLALLRWAVQWP
jgi:phosphatidylglycerophosphatase A